MTRTPEELPGGERLGALIRRAYTPPEDLKAPVDLAVRVRRLAEQRASKRSPWARLREFLAPPAVWGSVAAGALAVLLAVIFIPKRPLDVGGRSGADRVSVAVTEAAVPSVGGASGDPLSPDFFKFEGGPDEEMAVELADGWNAVTIEDETNETALVYFFSEEGAVNGEAKAH